jgi:hypothetical protein
MDVTPNKKINLPTEPLAYLTVVMGNCDQKGKWCHRAKLLHSHQNPNPQTVMHFPPSIFQIKKNFGTGPYVFLHAEHVLCHKNFEICLLSDNSSFLIYCLAHNIFQKAKSKNSWQRTYLVLPQLSSAFFRLIRYRECSNWCSGAENGK